ncbi:Cytochrome P450 4V2 [Frankliniella fusca]|uniref:Cytochrome P450 4V2 n=1 Tax=Frankliniella fusca TaxID=407009 RepID=A0AAE1LD76_9NEOP|nr:Cytochrome P450 4V2 [Frankliniella fusca]
MSPLLLAIAAALLGVLALRGLLHYKNTVWRWHTLTRDIPGPRAYPLIGCCPTLAQHPDRMFELMLWLWRKFGSTIKLWLGPFLFTVLLEPDDVEVFMTHPALADKPVHYDLVKPLLGEGLITLNNPEHRRHRKIISTSLHLEILKGFVSTFSDRAHDLVTRLRTHAERGEVVDMSPYLGFCVNHSLCDTVLSTDMSGVEADRDELIRVADQASMLAFFRYFRPWYWSERVFKLLSSRYKEYRMVVHGMQDFVCKVFNLKVKMLGEGKRPDGKRLAFLDHVLASDDARATLTEHEIKEELRTLIWAGSTTSTDFLSFFFIMISLLPEIQSKIHEELDEVFGEERGRPVDNEDLQHLQYLERCIKEALRMFPPVCTWGRLVKEDINLPSGYTLPKGSVAVVVPYATHRTAKWFPDPERFDPDRFLLDNCTGRHPFAYIPFSAGSRNCVGQRYAMMSMKTLTASVLRTFSVLPDPNGPKTFSEIPITIGLSMVPTRGARVVLAPRRTPAERAAGSGR